MVSTGNEIRCAQELLIPLPLICMHASNPNRDRQRPAVWVQCPPPLLTSGMPGTMAAPQDAEEHRGRDDGDYRGSDHELQRGREDDGHHEFQYTMKQPLVRHKRKVRLGDEGYAIQGAERRTYDDAERPRRNRRVLVPVSSHRWITRSGRDHTMLQAARAVAKGTTATIADLDIVRMMIADLDIVCMTIEKMRMQVSDRRQFSPRGNPRRSRR